MIQNEIRLATPPRDIIQQKLVTPNAERIFYIRHAMRAGLSVEEIHNLTKIDPWFLAQLRQLVDMEYALLEFGSITRTEYEADNPKTNLQELLEALGLSKEPSLNLTVATKTAEIIHSAKSLGFSDRQIAAAWSGDDLKISEEDIRKFRIRRGLVPSYRLVDTCAAEFEAYTPYYYSTYDNQLDEVRQSDKKKIMILGAGRTGSGRVLSSITVACMPPLRCARSGTKR